MLVQLLPVPSELSMPATCSFVPCPKTARPTTFALCHDAGPKFVFKWRALTHTNGCCTIVINNMLVLMQASLANRNELLEKFLAMQQQQQTDVVNEPVGRSLHQRPSVRPTVILAHASFDAAQRRC